MRAHTCAHAYNTHTHTLSLSLSEHLCTQILTHSLTLTHSHSLTLTHTHSLTHLHKYAIPSPLFHSFLSLPRLLTFPNRLRQGQEDVLSFTRTSSLFLFHTHELSLSLSHARALVHTCRGRIVSELELGGFSTMESLQSFDHKVFCGDLNYRCSHDIFWELDARMSVCACVFVQIRCVCVCVFACLCLCVCPYVYVSALTCVFVPSTMRACIICMGL
jgi:hypothetical protein